MEQEKKKEKTKFFKVEMPESLHLQVKMIAPSVSETMEVYINKSIEERIANHIGGN